MNNPQFICFGEILWDVFPDRKVIGGAPLNVALRLHSFGNNVGIISAIGRDANGEDVLSYLGENDLDLEFIQQHDVLPTGIVEITLDDSGSAVYEINKPVAWDAIRLNDAIVSAVRNAPFFLFGSLAVRGAMNLKTLDELLKVANTKIFDVNLRPPHYNISMVYEMMQRADFVKLNEDELMEIAEQLGCQEKSIERQIQWLVKTTNTKSVCVTRGATGAILYFEDIFFTHKGYTVEVEDTVGAGDSFLAALIHELYVNKMKPNSALARACAVGALVASKAGANCPISVVEIEILAV